MYVKDRVMVVRKSLKFFNKKNLNVKMDTNMLNVGSVQHKKTKI